MSTVDQWPWPDVMGTLQVQLRWWARLVQGRPRAEEATRGPARVTADALAEALIGMDRVPDRPCQELSPTDLIAVRAGSLVEALGGRRAPAPPPPPGHVAVLVALDRIVVSMRAAGRAAVAAHPPVSGPGMLVQVGASGGGAPKAALPGAVIGSDGIVGDVQRDRANHGRPWQAVSLWSADVVDALVAEGHPVAPGSCGENLLVRGVDWAEVRPGVRLHVGPEAVIEVSSEATPCQKIAESFVDRRFDRVDHDRHPGWSRAYAWVERSGPVAPDDPVSLG